MKAPGDTSMVDALPDMIRIGPFDFAIEKMETRDSWSRGIYGQCSTILQTIAIVRHMPSRHKAVDTLLHEILHALWWERDIEDADKEERTVACLGTALTALYRDNPWLVGWIKRGVG
jgi:hypothetical protein